MVWSWEACVDGLRSELHVSWNVMECHYNKLIFPKLITRNTLWVAQKPKDSHRFCIKQFIYKHQISAWCHNKGLHWKPRVVIVPILCLLVAPHDVINHYFNQMETLDTILSIQSHHSLHSVWSNLICLIAWWPPNCSSIIVILPHYIITVMWVSQVIRLLRPIHLLVSFNWQAAINPLTIRFFFQNVISFIIV